MDVIAIYFEMFTLIYLSSNNVKPLLGT